MKNFLLAFKLMVLYPFRFNKSKKTSSAMILLYVLLGIYAVALIGILCMSMFFSAKLFNSMGILSQLMTFIMFIACFVIVIFGIVTLISSLYFARDFEFWAALPMKPQTVFFAKLAVIYVYELAIELAILLPLVVTIGISVLAPPIFYIFMLIALIALPALPLMLGCIVSVPLMYMVSWFRRRAAVTSIVIILIFGLAFLGYFILVGGGIEYTTGHDGQIDFNQLMLSLHEFFQPIMTVMIPYSAIANIATQTPFEGFGLFESFWIHIGLFLGSYIVMGLITFLLSSFIYSRGASAQIEGAKSSSNGKEKNIRSSVTKALVMKEFRDLLRTPAFAFQCLSCVVLGPIIVAFMGMSFSLPEVEQALSLELSARVMTDLVYFMIVLMMGASMNLGANTSFTREGTKFYYCKIIPVSYQHQIFAKKVLYMIIGMLSTVLGCIVMFFITLDPMLAMMSLICGGLFCYMHICMALLIDLSKPKLDWSTPNEAVKNSRNAIVPMFVSMGTSMVLYTVMIIPVLALNNLLGVVISWGIGLAISSVLAYVFHTQLAKHTQAFFGRIEV